MFGWCPSVRWTGYEQIRGLRVSQDPQVPGPRLERPRQRDPDVGPGFALGDALSPTDDVQNSVLANEDPADSNFHWKRTPDYRNTLGYDNHRFVLDGRLANGTSSLTVDHPSTGEGTNIGALYAVVDLQQ